MAGGCPMNTKTISPFTFNPPIIQMAMNRIPNGIDTMETQIGSMKKTNVSDINLKYVSGRPNT